MESQDRVREMLAAGKLPTVEDIYNPSSEIEDLIHVDLKQKKFVTNTSSVEIVKHFDYATKKIGLQDFVARFRNRYSYLKTIFYERADVYGMTSISKLVSGEEATIIAMIMDIKKLPTGTTKLVLEDLSGQVTAVITTKDPELADKLPQLTFDEVLAFSGSYNGGTFFVNDLFWPDIPFKNKPKAPEDVYVVFCGDVHAGSNMFLPKEFTKFTDWLKGESGTPAQREIAKKTKYVIVLGDVVDGIGIYPEQNKELRITDIYRQYDEAFKFLQQIPDDKQIIIIPGNHDAMRLAEPQPALYKTYAEKIYELPNAIITSNPSIVNLHKSDNFPGVDVMIYHGYSFDYFIDSVEYLRKAGGYDASDKLWEYLLKRRHLSPTYGANPVMPNPADPLLIRHVPDIVCSGHIHKAKIGQYRGVVTVSGSCWQDTTTFQTRVGHTPTPGAVPIVNLRTWETNMLHFK